MRRQTTTRHRFTPRVPPSSADTCHRCYPCTIFWTTVTHSSALSTPSRWWQKRTHKPPSLPSRSISDNGTDSAMRCWSSTAVAWRSLPRPLLLLKVPMKMVIPVRVPHSPRMSPNWCRNSCRIKPPLLHCSPRAMTTVTVTGSPGVKTRNICDDEWYSVSNAPVEPYAGCMPNARSLRIYTLSGC